MKKYIALLLSFSFINSCFAGGIKRKLDELTDNDNNKEQPSKKQRIDYSIVGYFKDKGEKCFGSYYRLRRAISDKISLDLSENMHVNPNTGKQGYFYKINGEPLDSHSKITVYFDDSAPFSKAFYKLSELKGVNGRYFKPTHMSLDYYFNTRNNTLKIISSDFLKFLSVRFSGIHSLEDEHNTFTLYAFNPYFFQKDAIQNPAHLKALESRKRKLERKGATPFEHIKLDGGSNQFKYTLNLERVFESQKPGSDIGVSHVNIFDLFMPHERIEIDARRLKDIEGADQGNMRTPLEEDKPNPTPSENDESASSNRQKHIRVPEREVSAANITQTIHQAGALIHKDLREQAKELDNKNVLTTMDVDTESTPSSTVTSTSESEEPDHHASSLRMIPEQSTPNIPSHYRVIETPLDQHACSLYAFYGSLKPDQAATFFKMNGASIRAYAAHEILAAFEKAYKEAPHALLENHSLGELITFYGREQGILDSTFSWHTLKNDSEALSKLQRYVEIITQSLRSNTGFESDALIQLMAKIHGVNVEIYSQSLQHPARYITNNEAQTIRVYHHNLNLDLHQSANHFSMMMNVSNNAPSIIIDEDMTSVTTDEDSDEDLHVHALPNLSAYAQNERTVAPLETPQQAFARLRHALKSGNLSEKEKAMTLYERALQACLIEDMSLKDKFYYVQATDSFISHLNEKERTYLTYQKASLAILRTDLNADDKFYYIKQALKSNVSFTAEQKAFLIYHQAYQCFLSTKAQTKDKLSYIRAALKSPTALAAEQYEQLQAAKASLTPRPQMQENEAMRETEQPSHKHTDNVLSETHLVEEQPAPDYEESNPHTIPTQPTDSLTVEAFTQEIKGTKISTSQFNQIEALLKNADAKISPARKAILMERRAVYISFDSQRSNVEVLQAAEEALVYKENLNKEQIAQLYDIRAFNMSHLRQRSHADKMQAAEEALVYKENLNKEQIAELYNIKDYNMSFDKRYSNAEKVQAAEEALRYKNYLDNKQIAQLYDIRAFNMNFDKRYSNAEIVQAAEEALRYKNYLDNKQIAQLYDIRAYVMSHFERLSAEKVQAAEEALKYKKYLTDIKIAQLYDIRAFNMNFDKRYSSAARVQAAEEALRYKNHLDNKKIAQLYDIRAFNMNFDKRYSNAEKVQAAEETLKYKKYLDNKKIAQFYDIKAFNMSRGKLRSDAARVQAAEEALRYKNHLDNKKIAQLYNIRAFNMSFIQKYSNAEKIAAINEALKYQGDLKQNQIWALNNLKKKFKK